MRRLDDDDDDDEFPWVSMVAGIVVGLVVGGGVFSAVWALIEVMAGK